MTAIFDRAAKDLAALDFTAENEVLAVKAAEGERLSAAMLKAEARIREVQAQLSALLQDKLAPQREAVAVADALLGAGDASQATATLVRERDLREEQAALRAGLRELQDRSRDNGEQMARIKSEAAVKVVPVLQPVVDTLIADARAAADQIATAFASIAAISGATRYFSHETRQFGEALAKLMASELITRRDIIETPDDITEMFAPLASKGPCASYRVPTFSGVPDDHIAIGVMAGLMARKAVG